LRKRSGASPPGHVGLQGQVDTVAVQSTTWRIQLRFVFINIEMSSGFWGKVNRLALPVAQRLRSEDVLAALAELFVTRGPPAHVRWGNGPEFIANAVKEWLARIGVLGKGLRIIEATLGDGDELRFANPRGLGDRDMLLPFISRIGIGSDAQDQQFLVVILQCQVLEDGIVQIDDLDKRDRALAHHPDEIDLGGQVFELLFHVVG
jgi:hypothetical protein